MFEHVLADALELACIEGGWKYPVTSVDQGAYLWARTGCAYLSMVLLGTGQNGVRQCQILARETAGPVLLECTQYDDMARLCLDGCHSKPVLLSCNSEPVNLQKDLFLEMLDFLREG